MNNTVKISATIGTTDKSAGLDLEIQLDGQQIFYLESVNNDYKLVHELDDADGEHELCFIMKNKNSSHTQIDKDGNIVKDSCITISNVEFDEIPLEQVFVEKTVYTHNFNGTREQISEKFYGEMGCNGVVSLKFVTPMYLWLLENV